MTEFAIGDKVWPKEGPMVLQNAPQKVIGIYSHPFLGDWLWLDDNTMGFRSYAAEHWTTQEPDEDAKRDRTQRKLQRIAENREGTYAYCDDLQLCFRLLYDRESSAGNGEYFLCRLRSQHPEHCSDLHLAAEQHLVLPPPQVHQLRILPLLRTVRCAAGRRSCSW